MVAPEPSRAVFGAPAKDLENPMRSNTSLNIVPKKMEATPYGLDVFGGGSENSARGRARYHSPLRRVSRIFYDTHHTQRVCKVQASHTFSFTLEILRGETP